jgi:hypothetical protein
LTASVHRTDERGLPNAHRALECRADLGRLASVKRKLGEAAPQQRIAAKLVE